ncbi:hypothetical protein JIG36_17395 [Actinoplanes sp. LDG1-06]|uniref:Uncharacterized protein n=1 Tax=Paractinoplanes ovalisporus TaxID=2810368 RepID=A0ABS2ABY1_9ACTN|nr:hypothetical protein [Actinoplanes ovalisporus]MBM2617332.1 hypothetical protein [Actinoplanes ovalisporus]
MAAVTAPERVAVPAGEPPHRKRRWWAAAIVGAWIVVVSVLAVWSVGHERATVPEQRDLSLAVTDLQRAAGVVYAAAGGDGRAAVLGGLEFTRDCRVTPVRDGLIAARTITVQVPGGDATGTAEAIAAALPGDYQADVAETRGGTRVSLHADAGNFIGVDMNAPTSARALTLRLSSGCRPVEGHTPSTADPGASRAAPAPALLTEVLRVLGAPAQGPEVQAVTCADGTVAASYTVAGVPMRQDFADRLRKLPGGAGAVQVGDPAVTYTATEGSAVVAPDGPALRVTVSTPCR